MMEFLLDCGRYLVFISGMVLLLSGLFATIVAFAFIFFHPKDTPMPWKERAICFPIFMAAAPVLFTAGRYLLEWVHP